MRSEHGVGWAWQLEEGDLCHWAEPDKARLEERSKPSTDATAVRVRIIPLTEVRQAAEREAAMLALVGALDEYQNTLSAAAWRDVLAARERWREVEGK